MRDRPGAVVSVVACLAFLALLAWPYLERSTADINTYYASGVLDPLVAGLLVTGVVVSFVAVRGGYVTAELGAGVVLGFGLAAFLVVVLWAPTARVDVFRAPGWAFPAHRWVLLALAALVALGASWHARSLGLLSASR